MKLRVEYEDGRIETINLDGTWRIVEGWCLNRVRDDRGMDHFFTKDGHYDGSGSRVSDSEHLAELRLGAMEEKRETVR